MTERLLGCGLSVLLLLAACASAPAPRAPAFTRLETMERLGLESVEHDRWDRAMEFFTQASLLARSLDQRPAEARAELNRAWIEERSSRPDAAAERLRAVLEGPYAAQARGEAALRLARLAADTASLPEARRLAARARELLAGSEGRSSSLELLGLRLDVLEGQGDKAYAALPRLLDRAQNAQDKSSGLRLLARLQLERKLPAAALQSLQEAERLDSEAGRSAALAQNLALRAQAQEMQGLVQEAGLSRERAVAVCQAWLARFHADARWRPRDCGSEPVSAPRQSTAPAAPSTAP